MQNFVELTQIDDDPRFGNIKIMYDPKNPQQRVMCKINKCRNLKEFKASQKQVQTRRQIDHPNILQLVSSEFNEQELCTSVYFEYPDEIIDLNKLKPKDSIFLFKDVLQAIQYLQDKKRIHGDIRPEFINYDTQNKRYILLDRLLDISLPIYTQLNNIKNYKSLYMSPIIFNELMKKSKKIKQNSYKSELFSLGMICLSIFESIDKIQSFYCLKTKKFDQQNFQELLKKIQKRNYSEIVKQFLDFLIDNVLILDERKRQNPRKLQDKLQQYPQLQHIFLNDILDQDFEQDSFDQQNNQNQQSLNSTIATDLTYYNPFDFVEVEQEKMFESDAGIEMSDNEPIFDNTKQVRISEKISIDIDAKKQNILVVTQDQFLIQDQKMQKKQNPCIINNENQLQIFNKSIPDKLNQLKYFKLKIQIQNNQKPNTITNEKKIRVSTKVVKEPKKLKDQLIQNIIISKDQKQTKQLEQDSSLQKFIKQEIQQQIVENRLSDAFSKDDNESTSSKPLTSKNSEQKKEGDEFSNYFESLGIKVKEENQNDLKSTQSLAQKLSSLKELEMFIKNENDIINKEHKIEKSPQNTKKNLKQFLRTTSYKPKEDQNDDNTTSIKNKMNQIKRKNTDIIQSFNFINPKEQNKTQEKVITGNYQIMNLNTQKKIGSNLKQKINNFKRGIKSDKYFFNINKKLSQSPVNKSDNIIQFDNTNRAKSQNIRGVSGNINFSQRLHNLNYQDKKALPLKYDKQNKQNNFEIEINDEPLIENKPYNNDKQQIEFPSKSILNNIEIYLKLKKYEQKEQESIITYQKNQPKMSITSFQTQNSQTQSENYQKKNLKYSYKLENNFNKIENDEYYNKKVNSQQNNNIMYQTQIDFRNNNYQQLKTKNEILKKFYQTESRQQQTNNHYINGQQHNQRRITQDSIDQAQSIKNYNDLRNQITQKNQQRIKGFIQNQSNPQFNTNNIYTNYQNNQNKYQDKKLQGLINSKLQRKSIEHNIGNNRDRSLLKQPQKISSKFINFDGNNNNQYMRNTINIAQTQKIKPRQLKKVQCIDQYGKKYYKFIQLIQ